MSLVRASERRERGSADYEASNNVREARLLAAGRPDILVRQLDVSDQNELSEVVASSDVVVR